MSRRPRPVSPRARGAVLSAPRPGLPRLLGQLRVLGLLAPLALPALAACGGDGPVRIAAPPAADRTSCARLADRLPDTLGGLEAVATSPADAAGGAWGDPPVTLTCGVGVPKGFGPASSCLRVEGVDWFAPDAEMTDNGSDITLTSVTLRPRVALHVPATHRGDTAAAALVDLAGPLRETLRADTRCQ